MIGIRRLAEHLNISIGTVSRALNGRRDVSEATRNRVLEAARQLGYVANQSGRSLRQGTTRADRLPWAKATVGGGTGHTVRR